MASTIAVSCNVCGYDEFRVIYPAGAAQVSRIVQCAACGLMYANPRHASGDAVLMAEDSEFDFSERFPQRYEKEQVQLADMARTRALLGELHPCRGKLVEIGSSCGFQLNAFKQEEWDVLGIEPDRNAARHAIEKLEIPTLNTILEQANVPDESADAVVMLHVIEHIPDPVGTLSEIFRVLKPVLLAFPWVEKRLI